MATRRIELGWAGQVVRHNLPRYRKLRRMTLAELSARLDALARPMSVPTLSAVENGKRRIDVDDLVALALALDVIPTALLMPPADHPDARVEPFPGAPPGATAAGWWAWLAGRNPLREVADRHELETWRRAVTPPWTWEDR